MGKRPMELKDTVEMMNSEDYKERFKAEYCQTVIRYRKLKNMLDRWDKASLASLAGQALANAADNALRSIDGYGAGAEFAAGYANGIWGGIGSVVAAAASMASQAIAAVKAEQASASPSKKPRKLAHDFGDGYAGGIRDKEDDVAEAASELSDTAMDALDFTGIDVSSMVSKMKQAVFQDKAAVAGMMSAQFVNKAYREVNVENRHEAEDYEKMANAIISAFIRAGIHIDCDKRIFGRLVSEVI